MRKQTLGALCTAIVDCAHKTAPLDNSGEYFAVGTPAMRGNTINLAEARRISRETFEAWTSRMRPRAGDILLAREAPVGPVVRIPSAENVAPGQRTVLLRPDQSVVDADFLYYYLVSPAVQSNLLAKAAGSTVPHLNVADLRTFPVSSVPPLGVQKAIAEVLGALDDKIAANDRVVEAAEGLMVALASRCTGSVELSGLADQAKHQVRPEEFATRVAHFSLPAFDDGKVPAVELGHDIKSAKFLVREPSVLVSKLNPRIPRIWDVPSIPSDISLSSTEFVVLVPRTLSTTLLWALLKQSAVQSELAGKVAGTSGSHQRVKPSDILSLRVGDPTSLHGGHIELLRDLGAHVQNRRAEGCKLAATRDELLPLLMSGRVRVRDAEKVVSEVA